MTKRFITILALVFSNAGCSTVFVSKPIPTESPTIHSREFLQDGYYLVGDSDMDHFEISTNSDGLVLVHSLFMTDSLSKEELALRASKQHRDIDFFQIQGDIINSYRSGQIVALDTIKYVGGFMYTSRSLVYEIDFSTGIFSEFDTSQNKTSQKMIVKEYNDLTIINILNNKYWDVIVIESGIKPSLRLLRATKFFKDNIEYYKSILYIEEFYKDESTIPNYALNVDNGDSIRILDDPELFETLDFTLALAKSPGKANLTSSSWIKYMTILIIYAILSKLIFNYLKRIRDKSSNSG